MRGWRFILLLVSIPLCFLLDLLSGSIAIPAQEVISILFDGEASKESWEVIVLQSRLPRAVTAMMAGAGLAVSGLLMQTLFRNPLAGPYILGVSSGAGLGVAILIMGGGWLGWSMATMLGGGALAFAAMAGASMVLFLIFLLSLRVKDMMTVLIVGIMLGSVITAIVGLIQYLSTDVQLKSFIVWTLGSVDGLSYQELSILAAVVIFGLLLSVSRLKALNVLLLGENYALSMGIKLKRERLIIILISSMLAGVITAYCGLIGFIGIIVPHLCRLFFKASDHKTLIPASILMGASILLFSDLVAHLPGSMSVIPISSVTAIIGIPVILWMLLKRQSLSRSF